MYGQEEPKFPTKIPTVIQIIGWCFIIWFFVNFFSIYSPHSINLADGGVFDSWLNLVKSLGILHLIVGIVLILNGVALSKIIRASKHEIDRLARHSNSAR